MDAQTDRIAARATNEDVPQGPGARAHSHLFDELAMLEDVVGALVPELDKILSPHDPEDGCAEGDCDAAPATSQLTADLERAAYRLSSLRSTLQSVRRRIEL